MTYHSDYTRLSSTMLGVYRESPLLFCKRFIERSIGDEDTAALRFGRAAHTWVLEPDQFWLRYCRDLPGDKRTKAYRLARAVWEQAQAGREAISFEDEQRLQAIGQSIASHRELAGLLTGTGEVERVIQFEAEGHPARAKLDKVFPEQGLILDLKTARTANPGEWKWDAKRHGYCHQAAWYMDAATAEWGPRDWTFLFGVLQAEEPYEVSLVELPRSWVESARQENYAAVREIIERKMTGDWRRWHGVTQIEG